MLAEITFNLLINYLISAAPAPNPEHFRNLIGPNSTRKEPIATGLENRILYFVSHLTIRAALLAMRACDVQRHTTQWHSERIVTTSRISENDMQYYISMLMTFCGIAKNAAKKRNLKPNGNLLDKLSCGKLTTMQRNMLLQMDVYSKSMANIVLNSPQFTTDCPRNNMAVIQEAFCDFIEVLLYYYKKPFLRYSQC